MRSGQNRSSAVMQQRIEPHDSLDFYPTPPWATRALCEWLKARDPDLRGKTAWDPACGEGDMVRPLYEYFGAVRGSDVHAYRQDTILHDFLMPGETPCRPHWIITNPPFRLAADFVQRALECSMDGCAMLVRIAFLEGVERYRELFSFTPPSFVLQFSERVTMVKGRLEPGGGSATAYAWLVWEHGLPRQARPVTEIQWIPPCRKKLERASDYEAVA